MTAWEILVSQSSLLTGTAWELLTHPLGGNRTIVNSGAEALLVDTTELAVVKDMPIEALLRDTVLVGYWDDTAVDGKLQDAKAAAGVSPTGLIATVSSKKLKASV